MAIKKCKVTGKTRYPNQRFARRGMMYIISHSNTNMFDLHTYHCEHCNMWHVGHKSYYQKSLEQQKQIGV